MVERVVIEVDGMERNLSLLYQGCNEGQAQTCDADKELLLSRPQIGEKERDQ